VWLAHKDAGYLLTEKEQLLHYFVHDRGGKLDNFVQIAVWEEQEFVERELLLRTDTWGVPDVTDRLPSLPRRCTSIDIAYAAIAV
jgi:hypothetical protein